MFSVYCDVQCCKALPTKTPANALCQTKLPLISLINWLLTKRCLFVLGTISRNCTTEGWSDVYPNINSVCSESIMDESKVSDWIYADRSFPELLYSHLSWNRNGTFDCTQYLGSLRLPSWRSYAWMTVEKEDIFSERHCCSLLSLCYNNRKITVCGRWGHFRTLSILVPASMPAGTTFGAETVFVRIWKCERVHERMCVFMRVCEANSRGKH